MLIYASKKKCYEIWVRCLGTHLSQGLNRGSKQSPTRLEGLKHEEFAGWGPFPMQQCSKASVIPLYSGELIGISMMDDDNCQ
jgi:hypothetical protein